jgi:AAA domain
MTATNFDTAETISFLDQIFGDVNSGLISITAITHAGRTRSESFQWIRFAAARAAEWDTQRPQGIYFRCTMLPPDGIKGGRGTEQDSHALSFLWADLDYGSVGHKPPRDGLPLPPDEEAARKIITDLPPPTLLVHSGGGLYPIWQLDRPVFITEENFAKVKARSEQWQKIIQAKAERLGWAYGSGVGDLARILRLPGSINRKAVPMVRLTELIDELYEPPTAQQTAPAALWATVNGDSAFDKFSEAASWADILQPLGWIQVKPADSATVEAWQHPDATHPISAHVLKVAPYAIVNWSENSGLPVGKDHDLTKAKVYAIVNYNGDTSAAAKALIKGDAINLPAHVVNAVRSRDNIAGTVTEVTANQILGDSGEPRAGNPEEYLEVKVVEEALKLKIRELARERWAQEKAGETVLPDFIRLDDFLAQEVTEEPQLIKGLWNKATPVLFSAQFKAGKTTVRDNAVKCHVDGGRFLDRYDVTPVTDGTIVILDLELSENMMREWLRAHGFVNQNRVVVVPMRGRAHTLNLMVPEIRAKWAAQLREWNAKIALLDCLRPVLDGLGLNEDKDAGRFLNAGFDPLLVEAGGIDGMVIHHMGHTGERARGDSSMLGCGDSWRLLRKSDDPASPRYFTAYGRDIDVPESQLEYDGVTRTLTITGGSRKDAEKDAAWPIVKAWIQEHQGCSATKVVQAFNKTQTEYEPIAERIVRDVILGLCSAVSCTTTSTTKAKGRPRSWSLSTLSRPRKRNRDNRDKP